MLHSNNKHVHSITMHVVYAVFAVTTTNFYVFVCVCIYTVWHVNVFSHTQFAAEVPNLQGMSTSIAPQKENLFFKCTKSDVF